MLNEVEHAIITLRAQRASIGGCSMLTAEQELFILSSQSSVWCGLRS